MWRSCWPSGACTPITLRCGDGYSVTPRRWNYVCTRGSEQPATVGGSTRPTSGSRVSGCIYTALWTDSTGATIDFLLSAKRDAAAAERFLAKALSGANHPAPRVINTDKHAGYPPAIVQLKAEAALERNCRHRPVQLNPALDRPVILFKDIVEPTFSLVLGSLCTTTWAGQTRFLSDSATR